MADYQIGRAVDPILHRLEVLLSNGRTYIDDSRYEYPLVQYDWSSDTADQIQAILRELARDKVDVPDEYTPLDFTCVESLLGGWIDGITIPSTTDMNKGMMYRWLTSEDGMDEIKNALLKVLPNILLSKLDKVHRSMINVVLEMKTGGQVTTIIKAKRNQCLIDFLAETAKNNRHKLDISSYLIMGDPHGMRDIDVAVVITPDVAAQYPTLQHAKSCLDMESLRNRLVEHANLRVHKDNVHDLPPIGATIIVVDQVDGKDVIIATSGGEKIATNNIIASTQHYFHQPDPLLKIHVMNSDQIASLSYVLLWMAQKMKFLTPSLYNTHLMDDEHMPTYQKAIQSIYDNPVARISFSRSYIMTSLMENVKPTEKQWGTFKSLIWKLSQNIIIPYGYHPYTRWDVRQCLNLLYGSEFDVYCLKRGMSDVNLGDGAIWYMCEGQTRCISTLSNQTALAHMPSKLDVKFNQYVIPFMLKKFNKIIDEHIDAILVHTSLRAIPSILNTFAAHYPSASDLICTIRPHIDILIGDVE